METIINRLKKALMQELPGMDVQYTMAPFNRERILPSDDIAKKFRPSAVLIVFCQDEENNWYIPLIERMPYNGIHSAQISFPGGKQEPFDLNLEETAKRECCEEIGLEDVEIIGRLTHLYIPVSSFIVQPFVAISKIKNPKISPQEREVKSVLKLRIEDLMTEELIKSGSIKVGDNTFVKSPWYDIDGHQVWGATAMILTEMKEICKTIF